MATPSSSACACPSLPTRSLKAPTRRRRAGCSKSGSCGGGPPAIVTTLGVLRFPDDGGEAFLATVHPGHTVEEVLAETGWPLQVADHVSETSAPTDSELTSIRRFDPEGFWTRA